MKKFWKGKLGGILPYPEAAEVARVARLAWALAPRPAFSIG
jgi:hypothetical protein